MARTLKEARLSTRTIRAGLPLGLHWRGIDVDIHLGYRKSLRGGKWLVRYYVPERVTYRRIPLGVADDVMSEGTLTYDAAMKLARLRVAEARSGVARKEAPTGISPTVRAAVEAYIEMRDERVRNREGRSVRSDAASRLERHVLSDNKLCGTRLELLSDEGIARWRQRLSPSMKLSTRRRLFSDLKAALNIAHRDHRRRLPADFPDMIRHALRIEAGHEETASGVRDNQILPDEQVRKIIEMASASEDQDFARLVIVLAATGARLSQVRRMAVGDVQFDKTRLMVPVSRKGKGKQASTIAFQVGEDVLNALRPATADRAPEEPLLCRWRHIQTGPATWVRDRRGPWLSASEMTRPWQALCESIGLKGTIPYALRHSSIVRAIRSGLPIRLVAALHDTSVVMIERHYSRWIVDGLEELAARAIIPLVGAGEGVSPELVDALDSFA